MLPLQILYNILKNFTFWLLPLVLVLFSLTSNLPDANLHKTTLNKSDFYSKFTKELENNLATFEKKEGLWYLVLSSLNKDVLSINWLRGVVEQNVDLTTKWLINENGEYENWQYYLPASQIESSLSEQIDQETDKLVEEKSGEIKACSSSDLEKIKTEGFDLKGDFCLPESVLEKRESLSDFIEKNNSGEEILQSVLKNEQIESNKNRFSVAGSSQTSSFFNYWRDWFINLRKTLPSALLILGALSLLVLVLGMTMRKSLVEEIRNFCWHVGLSTLAWSGILLLILGGSFYATSWANSFLLPGFNSPELLKILIWQMLIMSFQTLSWAIWIGLGLLIASVLMMLLPKAAEGNAKNNSKNQKFAPQQADSNQNFTFDSQFQNRMADDKRSQNQPQTNQEFYQIPEDEDPAMAYNMQSEEMDSPIYNPQNQRQNTGDMRTFNPNPYAAPTSPVQEIRRSTAPERVVIGQENVQNNTGRTVINPNFSRQNIRFEEEDMATPAQPIRNQAYENSLAIVGNKGLVSRQKAPQQPDKIDPELPDLENLNHLEVYKQKTPEIYNQPTQQNSTSQQTTQPKQAEKPVEKAIPTDFRRIHNGLQPEKNEPNQDSDSLQRPQR